MTWGEFKKIVEASIDDSYKIGYIDIASDVLSLNVEIIVDEHDHEFYVEN